MKRQANKHLQLQIRVSAKEKAAVQAAAKRAGLGMSEWVLSQLFSTSTNQFQELTAQLQHATDKSYVAAAINDLLNKVTAAELAVLVREPIKAQLTHYWQNYIAAMVECAAIQKKMLPPAWVKKIMPLEVPVFGSTLMSLRLHLLRHSPLPFRRRNIFIDATIGQRV